MLEVLTPVSPSRSVTTIISQSQVPPREESARLTSTLSRLYSEQLAISPDADYLRDHARPRVVSGQVAAFRWYRRFLPPSGTVLDWGCHHAPDSCLVRAWGGTRFELHGCDFGGPGRFPAFHNFAGLAYTPLTHHYRLPYGDERFDAVIASGVLEHTVMDHESLKELYRVLVPGGILLITYLPNRWSTEEWSLRRRGRGHRRLYGLPEAVRMLLHSGFDVLDGRYQALGQRRPGVRGFLRAAIRTVLPLHWFSACLCFAARKLTCM